MESKTNRQVKLYGKSRPCQSSHTRLKHVPWLNLSGVWLEQAGFGVGDRVEITVSQNELIIKPLSS